LRKNSGWKFCRRWELNGVPRDPSRLQRRSHLPQELAAQEGNLFRSFSEQVLSGTLNSERTEMAFKTQFAVDPCFESGRIGQTVEL